MRHEHGESLMAVFEAIARGGEISRAQIADVTGYSQVTVGKAVDAFTAGGIISQHKQPRASAGRKTGVCVLERGYGMMLFDIASHRMRIVDIALESHGEFDCGGPDEMFIQGFGLFAEHFDGMPMGIGCVIPDGRPELAEALTAALGQPPELLTSAGRAAAAANAARFDTAGAAIFLRVGDTIDGALTMGGRLYAGASGQAGAFERLIHGAGELREALMRACLLLDPELVHVSCGEAQIAHVTESLRELPSPVIVEPASMCRDALYGAAMLLRERWLYQKLENIN